MGSKVGKIVLPLVAIAGTAFLTGPAGLGLWGAEAGAAAGTAAGAGLTEAAAAGGLGAAAIETMSLAPAGLDAAAAASFAAESTAMGIPTLAPLEAASGSWWSSLVGPEGIFTYKDALALGLMGGGQIASGMAQSDALTYQAAVQENAMKLQAAEDSVNLAEAEKASQRRLRQVLASQEVFYGAAGVSPSSGSALASAEAAQRQADEELSLFGTQRQMAAANPFARRRVNRAGLYAGSLLDFGVSAFDRARI